LTIEKEESERVEGRGEECGRVGEVGTFTSVGISSYKS
jgi:hypothetical protein